MNPEWRAVTLPSALQHNSGLLSLVVKNFLLYSAQGLWLQGDNRSMVLCMGWGYSLEKIFDETSQVTA